MHAVAAYFTIKSNSIEAVKHCDWWTFGSDEYSVVRVVRELCAMNSEFNAVEIEAAVREYIDLIEEAE